MILCLCNARVDKLLIRLSGMFLSYNSRNLQLRIISHVNCHFAINCTNVWHQFHFPVTQWSKLTLTMHSKTTWIAWLIVINNWSFIPRVVSCRAAFELIFFSSIQIRISSILDRFRFMTLFLKINFSKLCNNQNQYLVEFWSNFLYNFFGQWPQRRNKMNRITLI